MDENDSMDTSTDIGIPKEEDTMNISNDVVAVETKEVVEETQEVVSIEETQAVVTKEETQEPTETMDTSTDEAPAIMETDAASTTIDKEPVSMETTDASKEPVALVDVVIKAEAVSTKKPGTIGSKRPSESIRTSSLEPEVKQVKYDAAEQVSRAKYKEKALQHRKDHTRKILAQKGKIKRAFPVKDSDLLGILRFRNKLPDIPFKSKFVEYPYEPQCFTKYKPSMIEAEYVYELHMEPHLGLPIDLVDVHAFDKTENVQLELPEEDKAIFALPDDDEKKHIGKVRPMATWLRRTAYMGNDLFNSVHQFENEIDKQEKKKRDLEETIRNRGVENLIDLAENSFKQLPTNDKLIHPTKKSLKVAKAWDVFPDEKLFGTSYALLSYDVLPGRDMKGEDIQDRQNRAIVRNVDEIQHGGLSKLIGSLVVPDTVETAGTQKYSYFRDYQVDLKKTEEGTQYIFFLDPAKENVSYCELGTRVELKKTKLGDTQARKRGAMVERRLYKRKEVTTLHEKLQSVGGEYSGPVDSEDDVEEAPVTESTVTATLDAESSSSSDSDTSE